jgi:hypothetical protein
MTLKKTFEDILKDISTQVLETKFVNNLGQILNIMLDIKRYIFKLVKPIQPIQPKHVQLEPTCATITINHHMVMIQI